MCVLVGKLELGKAIYNATRVAIKSNCKGQHQGPRSSLCMMCDAWQAFFCTQGTVPHSFLHLLFKSLPADDGDANGRKQKYWCPLCPTTSIICFSLEAKISEFTVQEKIQCIFRALLLLGGFPKKMGIDPPHYCPSPKSMWSSRDLALNQYWYHQFSRWNIIQLKRCLGIHDGVMDMHQAPLQMDPFLMNGYDELLMDEAMRYVMWSTYFKHTTHGFASDSASYHVMGMDW